MFADVRKSLSSGNREGIIVVQMARGHVSETQEVEKLVTTNQCMQCRRRFIMYMSYERALPKRKRPRRARRGNAVVYEGQGECEVVGTPVAWHTMRFTRAS